MLLRSIVVGLTTLSIESVGMADGFADVPLPSAPKCRSGEFVQDNLYFGLSRSDGATVTETEWAEFLDRVVTPSFREGLTVINGRGQYSNRAGQLVKESSKLLTLIYDSGAAKESAIADIITAYKRAFAQESVLRVTSCVHVAF